MDHRSGCVGHRLDACVQRVRRRQRCKRCIEHAAEAGSHRESGVVGFLGQLQGQRPLHLDAAEGAVGIAGHDQVPDVGNACLGKLRRGKAFGTVSGTPEGDQQQRMPRVEVLVRRADDVRRRDGIHACGQLPVEDRRQALADVGGSARASEDHPCRRIVDQGCDEAPQPIMHAGHEIMGTLEHPRLLLDFAGGAQPPAGGELRHRDPQVFNLMCRHRGSHPGRSLHAPRPTPSGRARRRIAAGAAHPAGIG